MLLLGKMSNTEPNVVHFCNTLTLFLQKVKQEKCEFQRIDTVQALLALLSLVFCSRKGAGLQTPMKRSKAVLQQNCCNNNNIIRIRQRNIDSE